MIDDVGHSPGGGNSFEVLTLADIGIDREELHRRATMFTPLGLVVSAKPDLLLHLLGYGEPVLLLDGDSCVYGDLEPVAELASQHSLVLSPHSLDPHPLLVGESAEPFLLRYGLINTGFLGVARGAEPFLNWWRERTARHTVDDLPRGLYYEQTWATAAMPIFKHHILRDRGCNVMGWNLQARDVEWRGDEPIIDGGPLRHFHFNGSFDPERPWLLSRHQDQDYLGPKTFWPKLDQRPGVARICREYADKLLAAGYTDSEEQFATMPDGQPLEDWMREQYREALIGAERGVGEEPPNPFTHGSERFSRWLRSTELPSHTSPEMRAAAAEARAAAAEARAAAAEADVHRLNERVGELTKSWSWRLTRPLRGLGTILRPRARRR